MCVVPMQDTRQLQRPYAVKQWLEGGYTKNIPEQYVLLSEPDHIFILPPPLWATPRKPAAFEFGEPGWARCGAFSLIFSANFNLIVLG